MGEAEMLSALAPLLEDRGTAEEGMGRTAKARDDAIVAVMQKMERSIKRAVDVVEVDSSVPMHLQKINPFSGDDGFSCSSCHQTD
ncbi:unnamed protein product [Ascophyllum nodosum]